MPAPLQMTKPGIRKRIIALREQLTPDVRAACSEAISARIVKLEIYRQASTILGYMNFGAEFASEALDTTGVGGWQRDWPCPG